MIYYFAYGSNLHPLRLLQRIPSARPRAVATVDEYRLCFHKRGEDQSGKCNMFFTGNKQDTVHGVIYTMHSEHVEVLDQYEGEGYQNQSILITSGDQQVECFVYIAEQTHIVDEIRPYHWYRDLVYLGAKHHDFPAQYINSIYGTESIADPDPDRQQRHVDLIDKITKTL